MKRGGGGGKRGLTSPTSGEKHAGGEVVAVATNGHRRAHAAMVGCGASRWTEGRGNDMKKHAGAVSYCASPLGPHRRRCRRHRVHLFRERGRVGARGMSASLHSRKNPRGGRRGSNPGGFYRVWVGLYGV
jgi:hypothetical protein